MSKKSFLIILVLSVVVTYGVAIIESMLRPNSQEGGIPLRFGQFTLFGEASTNYVTLLIDIIFWFAVIMGVQKVLPKIFKK